MDDLIKRADAIDAVRGLSVLVDDKDFSCFEDALSALPSADANGEDLIIKGAKGIQDGLYNITDGKLFKYKANGGTVRTYPIVPSADAVDCTDFVNWLTDAVMDEEDWELNAVAYGEIICRKLVKLGVLEVTEEPSYYIRPSADAVSEDTQTEEQARFVAKETELAHIEARLENAEKRLQGVCVANFVAEQLERLREMTDEERLKLLQTMFPSADAVSREEYEETDGVIKIKKQSAKEVGEIEHIVVCSPNYTRYFYNESMPIQYKGGDG